MKQWLWDRNFFGQLYHILFIELGMHRYCSILLPDVSAHSIIGQFCCII